jgi:hypothetical protein
MKKILAVAALITVSFQASAASVQSVCNDLTQNQRTTNTYVELELDDCLSGKNNACLTLYGNGRQIAETMERQLNQARTCVKYGYRSRALNTTVSQLERIDKKVKRLK